MHFKTLDYYRIVTPASTNTQRVAFYEVSLGSGVFWNRQTKQSTDLGAMTVSPLPWRAMIDHMRHLAGLLKVTIQVEQPQPIVQPR